MISGANIQQESQISKFKSDFREKITVFLNINNYSGILKTKKDCKITKNRRHFQEFNRKKWGDNNKYSDNLSQVQETSNCIGNIAYFCNVKLTHFINNLNTYDYEEKQYLGSPSEDYHRRCNRSLDRNGNNSMHGTMSNIHLTPHFTLAEFCNLQKYPANVPSSQHVANIIYGCHLLLEPAREAIDCPIIINSGFRNADVNAQVGGVKSSQHLIGQAADIRPKDPKQFQRLVSFLKACEYTDQLLTGNGWLHISWTPFATPRHDIRLGYYK